MGVKLGVKMEVKMEVKGGVKMGVKLEDYFAKLINSGMKTKKNTIFTFQLYVQLINHAKCNKNMHFIFKKYSKQLKKRPKYSHPLKKTPFLLKILVN